MFVMMNSERLSVGTQGLGIGEVAYQSAVAYAKERLQGRSLAGAKHPEKPADPHHRASRRAPHAHDHARLQRRLPCARRVGRQRARSHGAAAGGRGAHRSRRLRCLDDSGGQGAVHRSGIRVGQSRRTDLRRPRLHRRSWHGTIRARLAHRHDLRGYERHPGARSRRAETAGEHGALAAPIFSPGVRVHRGAQTDPEIGPWCNRSPKPSARCNSPPHSSHRRVSATRRKQARHRPTICACSASWRSASCGCAWPKVAAAKLPTAGGEDAAFYRAKRVTAAFYIDRILPQAGALLYTIKAGKTSMMALEESSF